MKILLINPHCRRPVVLPLGLGYVASALRGRGHQVEVLDINGHQYSPAQVEDILQDTSCDCVGIGGLTSTYKYVKWLSGVIKRLKPGIPIIAGNMISTAYPGLLLGNTEVDIAVIDEGEETCKELISALSNGSDLQGVNGIWYKKNGAIYQAPPRPRISDLDSLAFPARDLFPVRNYIRNNPDFGLRCLDISAVRGCPYKCIYCSRPFGGKVTYRSVDNVIEEIDFLKKTYAAEYISFVDDMLLSSRRWIEEFCGKLLARKARVKWGASARVNLVDRELIRTMKKAGCAHLTYGFETGSQKILDIMHKQATVEQAARAIKMTQDAGIVIVGSFMVGMIGETRQTIRETVEFIKRNRLADDRIFFTTPFPGTHLYEQAKALGRLPENEEKYIESLGEMFSTFLVNLTDFSNEELIRLKKEAEEELKENAILRVKAQKWLLKWRARLGGLRICYADEGLMAVVRMLIAKLKRKFFSEKIREAV